MKRAIAPARKKTITASRFLRNIRCPPFMNRRSDTASDVRLHYGGDSDAIGGEKRAGACRNHGGVSCVSITTLLHGVVTR